MHQIQWHDVRGDRGNEPYDYSSKWKPISTEKVREIIARHNGPQSLPILLKLLAAGDLIGFPKFSIRRDPASVVPAPAKPLFSERMGFKNVLTNCDVLNEGLVKPKDPGEAAYSEDFLYALRKAKEIQERIHRRQEECVMPKLYVACRGLVPVELPVGVPADAQVVFTVNELESWAGQNPLEHIWSRKVER